MYVFDVMHQQLIYIMHHYYLCPQIRSDVNFTLNSTLSNIQTRSREMQKHFDRIDRLEVGLIHFKTTFVVSNIFWNLSLQNTDSLPCLMLLVW